jgi:3D (Asp-Asp-Asp) domain-containing protein
MIRKIIGLLGLTFTLGCGTINAEWLSVECSAYTPHESGTITATGEYVHVGGVACNFLPFGTVVHIDGCRYVVNDRCGIDDCIDIFMNDHNQAIEFGRQIKHVYIER